MFGTFQQSHLRIEIAATETKIGECLLSANKLNQWLWPQTFPNDLPEKLHSDLIFTSFLGFIPIQHQVKIASDNHLLMILSQGIDGYHEWYWGNGWVQSKLEGISLLPLNLGQSLSLARLRQFATSQS
jgi:hypothetical protein